MANPVCPSGCVSNLTAVSFDICAPSINLSEIAKIYIAKAIAEDFTDWEAPEEWATRLVQTGGTGDEIIRTLTVIGDKPAPSSTARPISGGRTINTGKSHVINFTIDETNDVNHEFIRGLECGNLYKIWYETKSGHLFGGNEGIKASIQGDMVLARGEEEIMVFNGTISWRSKFTEERTLSPIAA